MSLLQVLSVWCAGEIAPFVGEWLHGLYPYAEMLRGYEPRAQKGREVVFVLLVPHPSVEEWKSLNTLVSKLASSLQWTGSSGSTGIVRG